MLPKKRRVSRVIFDQMFKNVSPRVVSSSFFTARYFKSAEIFPSRISVAVSKKVSKLSVKRNLIKRRINSSLEKVINNLHDSYVIILFPKKGLENLTFLDIHKEVVAILEKVNVFKK